MPDGTIADLDELLLKCRSSQARALITEAVASYRSSAFRSSIVATWIAIAYDFIDKLRQLSQTGDALAEKIMETFAKVQRSADIKGSLRFEREILENARLLELLTDLECKDLERVFEDRNRCAHPSMNSLDETYNPSAELARLHIRNAVIHFLQHPPVQGKAALKRLLSEVESAYFPKDTPDAIEFFRHGPESATSVAYTILRESLGKERV